MTIRVANCYGDEWLEVDPVTGQWRALDCTWTRSSPDSELLWLMVSSKAEQANIVQEPS